ncbi:hypothetical protein [Natronoglycomyces albus]|uniref:Uncharacterized protein n=1 Tax=Natronoglycomyces albus TaxID=2811108 RepID=A0A895XV34_9ACTN|nr:hypothetical protein [Natronoglycomyces albus]QSB06386.1 hypothetical protein JQS30_05605 [Natronoglycomyces albus]
MSKRSAHAASALCLAIVLTSCSMTASTEDSEEPEHIPQSELDRLRTVMVDINTTSNELTYATQRLKRQCMEDQGFDFHGETLVPQPSDFERYGSPGTPPILIEYLPSVAEAEETGLGIADEWIEHSSGDFRNPHLAHPGWEERGKEYNDAYYEAMNGKERLDYSSMSPEEILEDIQADPVAAGGCSGLVAAQIYGVGADGLDGIEPADITDPLSEPPLPEDLYLQYWDMDFPTPPIDDAHRLWEECLNDRGHPSIPETYAALLYARGFYEDPPGTNTDQPWDVGQFAPELALPRPEGGPWPFDEARKREIEFALDVAECADDTEYRQITQHEWDQLSAQVILDHETEIFVWRDQMEAAQIQAQSLLAQ